jgi:hypothetical protein
VGIDVTRPHDHSSDLSEMVVFACDGDVEAP